MIFRWLLSSGRLNVPFQCDQVMEGEGEGEEEAIAVEKRGAWDEWAYKIKAEIISVANRLISACDRPPSSNFSSQPINATVRTPVNTTVPAAAELASPEQSSEQSIPALDKVPVGHDLSRFSIYPKLTVSQPNDPAEREADRVADALMRMPEAKSHTSHSIHPKSLGHDFSKISVLPKHQSIDPPTSILSQPIQRQCDACEDEEDEHLMRKEILRSFNGMRLAIRNLSLVFNLQRLPSCNLLIPLHATTWVWSCISIHRCKQWQCNRLVGE